MTDLKEKIQTVQIKKDTFSTNNYPRMISIAKTTGFKIERQEQLEPILEEMNSIQTQLNALSEKSCTK